MNGKTFAVDHLIKLTESRLVLVGNLAMIPLTVTYTYDGKNYVIEHTYGQTRMITTIDADAKFPHVDNLDNNTIALEFESNYQLKAAVATWNKEGRDAFMSFSKAFVANADGVYAYHGVAGMNSNKFIIAATGERNNGTGPIHEPHPIRCKVATVNNGEITFGDWELRWFSDSINWFALDNFNQHEALITYYDETEGNGIVAMAIFLDGPEATKVRYGGYTIIEHGGAAVSYQKITMRILSHSRFGVFFPDASNNGNLVFMMGERSSNNEITRAGANFVVARKGRRQQGGIFYFSIAAIDYKRFTLLDYFVSDKRKYSSLSIGYHMAYPTVSPRAATPSPSTFSLTVSTPSRTRRRSWCPVTPTTPTATEASSEEDPTATTTRSSVLSTWTRGVTASSALSITRSVLLCLRRSFLFVPIKEV